MKRYLLLLFNFITSNKVVCCDVKCILCMYMKAMYIYCSVLKNHKSVVRAFYCGLGLIKNNNSLKTALLKKKKNPRDTLIKHPRQQHSRVPIGRPMRCVYIIMYTLQ